MKNKIMKTGLRMAFISLMLTFLVLILNFGVRDSANAMPSPAAEFYGEAVNKMLQYYPLETNISAYDANGTFCGWFNTSITGHYGFLSCNGDDLDTAADEGANEGDMITFRINGETAFSFNDTTWYSGKIIRADIVLNRKPVFQKIGNLSAIEDSNFYFDFNGTDPDNDTLTYMWIISPDSPTFFINSSTGIVNITPLNDDVGVHYLRIIVSDGYLDDFQDVLYIVNNTNDPPYFAQNLTNQTKNESSSVDYDINCSDDDIRNGDRITYYLNIPKITISPTTGLISWVPQNEDVGNYTVIATCGDGKVNVSQTFNLEILDVNNAPVLTPIGEKSVRADHILVFNITATDSDNDELYYYSNSTSAVISKISANVATVTYYPPMDINATFYVNISVSDGELSDYEIVPFVISRAPYCGDLSCGNGENCNNCAVDCGTCPEGNPGGETGGEAGEGTGGEGAGSAGATQMGATGSQNQNVNVAAELLGLIQSQTQGQYICMENWLCSPWGECKPEREIKPDETRVRGKMTRECRDLNYCGGENNKPETQMDCEYIIPPTCYDKTMNQGETGIDCGGPCPSCPTCADGIKNQGETGIDCGGPCDSCTFLKYAQLFFDKPSPIIKRPGAFVFPWEFFIFIMIITASFIISDFAYLYNIKRKPIEDFSEKIKKYAPIRKKIYHFLANFDALGVVTIIYMFFLGGLFTVNIWIWLAAMIVTPFIVASLYKRFEYKEFRKAVKERKLQRLHNKEIRFFMMEEQKILIGMYENLLFNSDETEKLSKLSDDKKGEIEKLKDAKKILIETVQYSKEISDLRLDKNIKENLTSIFNDKEFKKFAKDYPEPKIALETIKTILNQDLKNEFDPDIQKEFILIFKDITKDKHLMSIIISNKNLVNAYNKLVDTYTLIKKKSAEVKTLGEVLSGKEKQLISQIEDISKDNATLDKIKKEKRVFGIFDSYKLICESIKKKQELMEQIK